MDTSQHHYTGTFHSPLSQLTLRSTAPDLVADMSLNHAHAEITDKKNDLTQNLSVETTTTSEPITTGESQENSHTDSLLEVKDVTIHYGQNCAIKSMNLNIESNHVYAFIGPSGCGKSTFLRCFNRMNDLISGFKLEGSIKYRGQDIYSPLVDPVLVRKHIGMVFQKPNPLPTSIYKNIAWGPKINGLKVDYDELVETCLKKAALWDQVKDRLSDNGYHLSGGQQQRLCIARAIAMKPEIILMDEPCSALDPISARKIEELISELAKDYSILIVTHNMQQAARLSGHTVFMLKGEIVEHGPTHQLFSSPKHQLTTDYISGKFG
ncbi:MAG: phosphate ABC transporter ATP-binding protein PstB [Proteobacteria bacterium]|nr:phosphate ABC transporter ATP-binding protein PstB [Pseudomonadota bacterium]